MLKVKLFANLREQLNCASMNVEYSGESNVSDLIHGLLNRDASWNRLTEQDVLVAVNQTLCSKDAKINDGDEVAFFPPVTGG
ncbi:MoaD/ThiS family protein [Ningiella sp. W23]|uniref:MoaD/ThiS family protein n=1 Tax=Ningiella sp. W23 TaxID=3023715 RepID=UPI0037563739